MGSARIFGPLIATCALALAACATVGSQTAQTISAGNVTEARLLAAADDPDNWLSYGRTWAEQRFSR